MPSAFGLVMIKLPAAAPAVTVMVPEQVLVAASTRLPEPPVVRPNAPLTTPFRVSCPAETVMVRVAVNCKGIFMTLLPVLLVTPPPRVT